MKAKVILISILCSCSLSAQDDVFALSPFTVDASDEMGYYASSSLAGTKLKTNIFNNYQAPVMLRKKADSVTLSVHLVNGARKASDRNEQVMDTVSRIIEVAEKTEGIRAHNGNISLSTRNSKVSIFSSRPETSEVVIYILGDLTDGEDVFNKTTEIKEFLENIEVVGETSLEEGNIGLSIKDPQSYRSEIISLILEDINKIKRELGGKVEMNINGLERTVVVKQANESEVDLLIPYSFTLRHIDKAEPVAGGDRPR